MTPGEEAVERILEAIGEDPTREGLLDTPARFMRSMAELTSGYQTDPAELLKTTFAAEFDEMIAVRDVPFWSLCEHHLLPFHGTATVAYIPCEGEVVGLSKLARLVHCYARRLQLQERMTHEIADSLKLHTAPAGVGVSVTASHTCMEMRGVRAGGRMTTTALLGVFREHPGVRAEFLALL